MRFLLFVIGLFVASRARADDTLTLWHAYTGAEQIALERGAAAFRRAHPDLTVEVLALPYGAYAAKLEAAIPAGRGPDLFIDAHERLPVFLERKLIGEVETLESEFVPSQLAVLREAGALYGVPLSVKSAALYLNTRLVPSSPSSLAELLAYKTTLPRDVYPLVFEADNPYYLAAFLHARGGGLLDEKGRYGFVGPAAEGVLETLRHWTRTRVLPEEPNAELAKQLFVAEKAAAMIGGPWLAPDLPKTLPWTVVPLPALSPGEANLAPFVTIEALYRARRAATQAHVQNLEALTDFLAFGEGAALRAKLGGQVVAARSVPPSEDPNQARLLGTFRTAAAQGRPMSIHPHMRRVWEPAQRAAKKALRGEGSIAQALSEGARRFEDATRPMPEPRSPTPLLVGLAVLLLVVTVAMVRRAMQPAFRARVRASLPAYAYVTHAFIAVALLVVAPLVIGAATSFFAGRGRDLSFVGLANYADILGARGGDLLAPGSFWLVLSVTVLWTVMNLALHVSLGLSLALLLTRITGPLSRLYRIILILPWAVPSYVTALAWKGMFHRQFGAINAILQALGTEPVSFFAQFSTAFSANLATNTWLGFPFMMVVTLGALTSIPKETYEAAAVDGAGGLAQLRLITLPMIRPVLAPAVAMGAVWTFNMFNVVFLVSGGEPDGSTEILVSEAYRWAFTRSSQYGYAAAYAVLIFGILLVGTRLMSPWLEEKRA